MKHRRKRMVGPVLALAATGAVVLTASDAAEPVAAAPVRTDGAFAGGQAALDRLGRRLPDVAAVNGLDTDELTELLLADDTLRVDRFGSLAYFDELAPDQPAGASTAADPVGTIDAVAAPPMTGPEFQLASLPGADLTIYLDFDGHTTAGTTWNSAKSIPTIVSPPYDTDGNPDGWSATELKVIRDSWAVVAEDFLPWQVNVTTIDPGAEALRRSGSGDVQWGVRVVITQDTWASCGCGGHAYIGAFSDSQDEPAFVYNRNFRGVSEAISHEVGHTLGLAHDGLLSPVTEYYRGHDGTGPGWAPIMGASYYEEVTQWSLQEYVGANNTGSAANYNRGADDVGVLSNTAWYNPPRRADDHGDRTAPTALAGPTAAASGIIGDRDDVDAFTFSTGGGTVSLAATVAALGANLDLSMSLRNAAGDVVSTSNPVDLLGATIDVSVPAGTYVVELDGVGVGDPSLSPPSGYTDYGSLGAYRLSASFPVVPPPDVGPPPDTTAPAAPTGVTTGVVERDVTVSWNANTEPDLAEYALQRDDGAGFVDVATTAATSFVDPALPVGSDAYRVVAVDLTGNRSTPSSAATAEITGPTIAHATSEATLAGTVTGTYLDTLTDDGVVQTITEVASSGKPTSRHDLLEHHWELPAGVGGHTLTIHASSVDGGDADAGVRFEVSDDGVWWTPVVTVAPSGSVNGTYDIGQRSGTVHLRVVDTDHSMGEARPDSVAVDHLSLESDGVVVTPPDPTTATATLATSRASAPKGEQYGVATVTVRDDRGDPVAGAAVVVQFSGAFSDRLTGVTGADGTVTVTTSTSSRKPAFSACVADVVTALTWVPGADSC